MSRWFILAIISAVLATAGGIWAMVSMPGRSYHGRLEPLGPVGAGLSSRLKGHVEVLAGDIGRRTVREAEALNRAADYIERQFDTLDYRVVGQVYTVEDQEVRNIEAERKGETRPGEIVVIGAHYDSPPGSPGADDNGSGVAALLELARLFSGRQVGRTVRFVAFVNEEPPYFQTDHMGSRVYASRAGERGEKIVAMLSLETIGYYSDEKGSQRYPPPFNLFYSDTGNFIAFVGNTKSGGLVRRCISAFRRTTAFPSEGAAVPGIVPGIGWSDHWSFWQEGYPAVMVTDTAPFRYPFYHGSLDTPEKLDYDRMARVVAGLAEVTAELADGRPHPVK